jgi:FMN-dependent oxidoreductase (nitrilotriacetate monooxygenase family)
MTTTFYPPWLLARSLSTMDHYSEGRIAWNIVTATSDAAAQNYGYDKQFEHDLRYDMADEYIDLCSALWDAWDADAVVMDEDSKVFIDPSKVKALNFEGKFYKSRGPLNVPRMPQGRPIYVAPGGSPRGRKFSGRNADIVLATSGTIADMKKYRDDVRGHAAGFGRNPDDMKVMFAVTPFVVDTLEDAVEMKAKLNAMKAHHMEKGMAAMSFLSGIDFGAIDPDAPIGEIKTNGMQTMLQTFAKHGPQATLREIMTHSADDGFNQMVGTPDMIASMMAEIVQEVGGDGFLIAGHIKPKFVTEICDRLVPELQRRKLTRTGYDHAQFRDNLMAF